MPGAVGPLLVSGWLSGTIGYAAAAVANPVNLHAVRASPLAIGFKGASGLSLAPADRSQEAAGRDSAAGGPGAVGGCSIMALHHLLTVTLF